MSKIGSLKDLLSLKKEYEPKIYLRKIESHGSSPEMPKGIYNRHILICSGTGCKASKSDEIVENFKSILAEKNIENVLVVKAGCFGFCEKGPIVKVLPDNTFYTQVKPEDVRQIIEEHIIDGKAVKKLLYMDPITLDHITDFREIEFYKKQIRIALRNCGLINPEDIEEYIACDGYASLGHCLEMKPEDVIKIIKDSGLRGRGGAGFPTGLKWEITSKSVSDLKYVVCNADEGDPGAFMDRSILEGDPNSIIEAMAICGYAVGAKNGLIYIRAEYPLAIHRLQIAIKQAQEKGLLGKSILGSNFDFNIEIRYGAGAFVCGEETALIHSMEGNRGEPTLRPPYPSVSGYFGYPTNVNNVETLANVPAIILNGSEWFSTIGTSEKSKGTKVFALAGKINNVGLIEVPQGITLREIIYEIGGGIKDGKKFKAVQTGGPSGGCLTEAHLDIPIDYENLTAVGSMMGSGGMIVMDEDDCMVSIAKFYLEFSVEESCGKCAPCRVGNKRLLEILTRITEGNGTETDIEMLKDLSGVIKDTAICGLGQTSPNPVLSTVNNFLDEYIEHVKDKRCRARQCHLKQRYLISEEKCVGCTACTKVCPVGAITGEKKKPHFLHEELCIRCGACYAKCKFNAIEIQ